MDNQIPLSNVSAPEPFPGYSKEAAAREELASRLDRAHAAVLPGALREAFAGELVKVQPTVHSSEWTLQPVTLGMSALLSRINSPLLDVVRIMREVFSRPEAAIPVPGAADLSQKHSLEEKLAEVNEKVAALKFEEEQIAETVLVFIKPAKEVRAWLDKGRSFFREKAMELLGDKLHPTQMAALQHACAQHYVKSFATIIGYGVPPPEGSGAVDFPRPSADARTGSAGG